MYKLGIHCGQWRSYDVIFFWLQLEWVIQHAIPHKPRISFLRLAGA